MIRAAVVLVMWLTVSSAHAGAWLQPKGKAYIRLSGGWLETNERFDKNGKVVPFDDFGGFRKTTYQDLESILYVEVGVHPQLTLLGAAMAKSLEASQEAVIRKTSGVADGMLGFKTKLWTGLGHVGSLSVEWWFPTGYDRTQYPSLGSGTHTIRLGAHGGAAAGDYWANIDLGYNLRENPFRDQIRGLLSGGYTVSRRWALRGGIGFQAPLGSEKEATEILFDPAVVDARGLEGSATVSFGMGRVALEGEVRSTLGGENILKGTHFGLALATNPSMRLWGPATPGVELWKAFP